MKISTTAEHENERHTENVPGRFWVNDECICCDMCAEIAPDFFRYAADATRAIVFTQPTSESDSELVNDALEECPVQAIQRD